MFERNFSQRNIYVYYSNLHFYPGRRFPGWCPLCRIKLYTNDKHGPQLGPFLQRSVNFRLGYRSFILHMYSKVGWNKVPTFLRVCTFNFMIFNTLAVMSFPVDYRTNVNWNTSSLLSKMGIIFSDTWRCILLQGMTTGNRHRFLKKSTLQA